MNLKLVDGQAVLQDGKPVYEIDGKDVVFDYASTLGTITRLNGEAKANRIRAEEAENRAKSFDGIEDPDAARKAMETVKKLGDKALFDSGKVDEIKAEAERVFADRLKSVEERYRPVIKERDALKSALDNEIVGGSFSRSKFITEKLTAPLAMVEATFRNNFIIDNGKLVAKDSSGNQVYSRTRPGELASFDEALEMLVDGSPFRDNILKGSGASGSGATSGLPNASGGKVLNRAAFDALDPVARMAHIKAAGTVTD